MTGGNLVVDPSSLSGLAGQVSSTADDFNASLEKVNNYNEELQSIWTGDDITAYASRVSEQAEEMKKFYNTLVEISGYMNNVARDYANAQETNKSMIHGS